MRINWFLPLSPDVDYIGTWPEEGAPPSLEHLVAITRAAEDSGFDGLLVPTAYGMWQETMTAAAAVLARTSRARVILAVRPNQFHPAQAAKMFAGMCRLFPGRIRLNVTTGGWPEDRAVGDFDDRAARYRRLNEWLEIMHHILYDGAEFSYSGDVYRISGARLLPSAVERIPIAMSGSSAEARAALARWADTYLLFGAPPADVATEIAELRASPGMPANITVGLRVHVIARPTEDEAWAAADRLISRVDPRVRETLAGQRHPASSRRNAQQALADRADLRIGPNLWAGVGTARFGVATALVGNPDQIVDRLAEYSELGVEEFILSGYPKLGEARRFGELVLPRMHARGIAPS